VTVVAPLVHHEQPARWVQDLEAVPLPRQRTDGEVQVRSGVLYGSFSCPWSYLASQRTDRIPAAVLRPAWRMIDPDVAPGTRLAAPGPQRDALGAERAAADLEAVRELLLPGEHLPARPPALVPHTGPAVVGYAEAVGAGVGDRVRRLLFDAYWLHGADIGLPDVLRRILQAPLRAGSSSSTPVREYGYAVTLTGGPITTDAHLRVRAWHAGWRATSADALPALTVDTTTTSGPAALTALTARLGPHPAATPP